jgi:hypothetical protein
MAVIDELKNLRAKGYDSKDQGMDSGEKNETPRIIALTDDEKKAFANSKPGEDLACEMHGSLESDGHFHVMSVGPMGGQGGMGEQEMAGQVAQRVQPNIAPSPS